MPLLVNDDEFLSNPCQLFICGTINQLDRTVDICLATDQSKENIPVQISIRLARNEIVRNSKQNGKWDQQDEKHLGQYPIEYGKQFDLVITNDRQRTVVCINGQFSFEYLHRQNPATISTLAIDGPITLHAVRIEKFVDYL